MRDIATLSGQPEGGYLSILFFFFRRKGRYKEIGEDISLLKKRGRSQKMPKCQKTTPKKKGKN